MRLAQRCSAWLLILWCAGVHAHAQLEETRPADHSVLGTAPAALVLRFSEAARLTALAIQKEGGPKQKLSPPDRSQTRIAVPLPALAPGHYVVSWRALGADGHVVPGQVRFTLKQ